jgi:hypothetical protein
MKKVLTLALTGVLAAAALAVESAPSNTVGFISRSIPANAYSSFSACPMGTATGVPALTALGQQGGANDRILVFTGFWASYDWSADWTWGGTLTFDYNGAYMYKNGSTTQPRTLVVAGDVIPAGSTVTIATFPGGGAYQGVGNPLPMDVDLDTNDLTLDADGFNTNDIILDWTGFWASYQYGGTGVYGVDFMAGKSYILKTAGAFTWDYAIPAGALATTPVVTKSAKAAQSVELN